MSSYSTIFSHHFDNNEKLHQNIKMAFDDVIQEDPINGINEFLPYFLQSIVFITALNFNDFKYMIDIGLNPESSLQIIITHLHTFNFDYKIVEYLFDINPDLTRTCITERGTINELNLNLFKKIFSDPDYVTDKVISLIYTTPEVVLFLLSIGIDVEIFIKNKLMHDTAMTLIDYMIGTRYVVKPEQVNSFNEFISGYQLDLKRMKFMVDAGIDPNLGGIMATAYKKCDIDTIVYLVDELNCPIDLNLALISAIKYANVDVTKFLLEHGAKIEDKIIQSAIVSSDIVKLLVEYQIDVNLIASICINFLSKNTIRTGLRTKGPNILPYLKTIKFLVENGANLNQILLNANF